MITLVLCKWPQAVGVKDRRGEVMSYPTNTRASASGQATDSEVEKDRRGRQGEETALTPPSQPPAAEK
jgi:hypothetical protein